MEQLYPGKGYIFIWPQNCKSDENLSMGWQKNLGSMGILLIWPLATLHARRHLKLPFDFVGANLVARETKK